jgi:hypothetical protein
LRISLLESAPAALFPINEIDEKLPTLLTVPCTAPTTTPKVEESAEALST